MNTKRLSSSVEILFWNATIDVLSSLQKIRQYSEDTSISVKALQRRNSKSRWSTYSTGKADRSTTLKRSGSLSRMAVAILILVGLFIGFLLGYWQPDLIF